jgi:hypothetical protein
MSDSKSLEQGEEAVRVKVAVEAFCRHFLTLCVKKQQRWGTIYAIVLLDGLANRI